MDIILLIDCKKSYKMEIKLYLKIVFEATLMHYACFLIRHQKP